MALKQISEQEYAGKEGYSLKAGDVLFNNTNSKELVGKTCLIEKDIGGGYSNHMTRIRVTPELCMPRYLALVLHDAWGKGVFLELANRWVGQAGINVTALSQFQIPLPPLEVQKDIVAEIEGYQKVIDGARAVLDNYRPHIPVNPAWPMVELGKVCKIGRGFAFKSEDYVSNGILNFRVTNIGKDRQPDLNDSVYLPKAYLKDYAEYELHDGDFVIVMVGATTGKIGYITANILPALLNQNMWRFFPDESAINKKYLYYIVDQLPLFRQGGARDYLRQSDYLMNLIPIPPLADQQVIVAEIEAEQALVASNKELISRMEKKIKAAIDRVWTNN